MSTTSATVSLIKHHADSLQRLLEKKFPKKPNDWSALPLHYVNKTVHDVCRSIPYLSAVYQDSLEVMVDTDDTELLTALNEAKIIVAWEPLTFRKMTNQEKEIILNSDPDARI